MKVGVFSYKPYDREFISARNSNFGFDLEFPDCSLNNETVELARPFDAVSVFVNDMIDHAAIQNMKDKVMIINTSRGGLVNTQAIVSGLKSEKIGYLGLDVHEMDSELSSKDLICETIPDDTYRRLATFPNVLITAHQGFFTRESLQQIADTTLSNLQYYFAGKICNETFLV
jgi:D-lactate dehydrogenase